MYAQINNKYEFWYTCTCIYMVYNAMKFGSPNQKVMSPTNVFFVIFWQNGESQTKWWVQDSCRRVASTFISDNQCFFVWWGQLAWWCIWCSVSHPVALVMIIYWRVCKPSPECLNHLEKPTFLCLFNNCWMHKYLHVSDLCPQKLVVCRIYFWYVKIPLPLFLYPRSPKGEGGILFYLCPSVCPSVRPRYFSSHFSQQLLMTEIWYLVTSVI
jgi:hypothetical protein